MNCQTKPSGYRGQHGLRVVLGSHRVDPVRELRQRLLGRAAVALELRALEARQVAVWFDVDGEVELACHGLQRDMAVVARAADCQPTLVNCGIEGKWTVVRKLCPGRPATSVAPNGRI